MKHLINQSFLLHDSRNASLGVISLITIVDYIPIRNLI